MTMMTPMLRAGRNKQLALRLDQIIKFYVEEVLLNNNYRLGLAAADLGISRTSLWRIMKKYGIVKRKKIEQ